MVKIFVCGDVLNYRNVDGKVCNTDITTIISNADYSICNFEAPIESFGEKIPKSGPHHYQQKHTLQGLKQQGFDLVCLANNHMMDYGEIGLKDTLIEANRVGLDVLGAGENFQNAYRPLIKNIGKFKVGFINGCEAQFGVLDYNSSSNQPGYAWINHDEVDKQIISLKKECDFVIVLPHAGLEHYNLPQKEWRNRYKHFCNLGADIVIGSHPHVPQGYEYHGNSMIFYSLGNFYFDSKNFQNSEDNSYSVIVELTKEKKISFTPIYHHKEKGKVQISPKEKEIDLEYLNSLLGEKYDDKHTKMSQEVYYKSIRKNLIYGLSPQQYDGEIISSIKRFIKKVIGKNNPDKDLQSLHYMRNETYYYAARHVLETNQKSKMKNKIERS